MKYESYLKRVQTLIRSQIRFIETDYKVDDDFKEEIKNAQTPYKFLHGLYCLTYRENYRCKVELFEEYADMLSVPQKFVESSELKSAKKIYIEWIKTK